MKNNLYSENMTPITNIRLFSELHIYINYKNKIFVRYYEYCYINNKILYNDITVINNKFIILMTHISLSKKHDKYLYIFYKLFCKNMNM